MWRFGGLRSSRWLLALSAAVVIYLGLRSHKGLALRGGGAEKLVALELSGELRSFEAVLPSWRLKLFPALGAFDVFAACVDEAERRRAAALLSNVGARRVVLVVRSMVKQNATMFGDGDWQLQPAPGSEVRRPIRGWLSQLAGVASASKLRVASGENYAAVVRCRFDLEFLSPLPLLLDERMIVFPGDQAHGGLNDKFAVGDPTSMLLYASLLDALSSTTNGDHRSFGCPLPGLVVQAERCLHWHLSRSLAKNQLRQDPRIQVRIRRLDGSLSETR